MFETIEFYYDKHFCIKYYSSIIHVYICTSANLESYCDQFYFMQFYGRFDFKAFGFFYCSFPVTRRGTDNVDAVGP